MPTDQDELLGYDADHEDPSQYCIHGTWIGSWWGPDYICQWCEDGYSAEEAELCRLNMSIRNAKTEGEIGMWINFVDQHLPNIEFRASMATHVVNLLLTDTYQEAIVARRRKILRLTLMKAALLRKFPDLERQLAAR